MTESELPEWNTEGLRFDLDMFEAGFTPTPAQLQRLREACDEIDRLRIAADVPVPLTVDPALLGFRRQQQDTTPA